MKDFHLLSSSVGSQKCIVSACALRDVGLSSGSAVQVNLSCGTFICKIYPKSHLVDSSVIVEDTVQVYERRHKQVIKNPKLNSKSDIVALKPLSATKVVVTIVSSTYEGVKALRKIKSPALVKSLLVGRIFMQNSAVNLNGCCPGIDITKILILRTSPENEVVTAVCKTTIIVESIVTQKLLEHQEKISTVTLGGLDETYKKLKELVIYPFHYPKVFSKLKAPRGILLHGPSGCGKSSIIQQLCDEFGLYLMPVTCSDLSSSQPGENEEKLKQMFKETVETAQENPTILFLDEIDSICPKRGGHSHTDRLIACLLGLVDELHSDLKLIVIAATSRPEDVDPALRRPGRLDREIYFGIPNIEQRVDILKALNQNVGLLIQCELQDIAELTPGYVGADLNLLFHETAYLSQDRGFVTMNDWKSAIRRIRPSIMRQGLGNGEFRKVNWEDVGGLEEAKVYIKRSVEWPLKYPEAFDRLNVPKPKGVLIYGPPGCGKSLLVRAAATSCAASFISISAAELFSPFVGDSEKMVTALFQRARLAAPTILFLDELDAMVGGRSNSNDGRSAQLGVIAALLQEMDGISSSRGVVVVGATNRPDKIDGALMRPGRFDSLVYIPNPDEKARLQVLEAVSKKMPLDNVDLSLVARQTHLFSGADLESLVKETALCALEEDLSTTKINQGHFEKGMKKVSPSLSVDQMKFYDDYIKSGKKSRT